MKNIETFTKTLFTKILGATWKNPYNWVKSCISLIKPKTAVRFELFLPVMEILVYWHYVQRRSLAMANEESRMLIDFIDDVYVWSS